MSAREPKRVIAKVEQYATDPASLADQVKRLKGKRLSYRLRVDDRRVLFTLDEDVLTVLDVPPRGSAYD